MKNNQRFLFLVSATLLIFTFSSFSKGEKKTFKGYEKRENGSYFLLIKKGTGIEKVDTGGAMFMKIKFKTAADSVFVDINKESNAASYPIRIDQYKFKGDFLDLISSLHVGDSASFFVRLDSLKKYFPNEFSFEPRYDTMKYLGFAVKIDSIYSQPKVMELRKKAEAEAAKQQAEMARISAIMQPIQDSAKLKEAMLKENDFALLTGYIKTTWKGPKNPDADGIFFQETKVGSGELLQKGELLGVKYVGKYLDGTIFDANTLVEGQDLLYFHLGIDPMIEGFTLGVSKMHPGSKAIFIVPSQLGYQDGLTRIFEVEIISAKQE